MRRKKYTQLERTNWTREYARGKSDALYRRFQCLNAGCDEVLTVPYDETLGDYRIQCPRCKYELTPEGETHIFNFVLRDLRDDSVVDTGAHLITHDEYLHEADLVKACIICGIAKPLDQFDIHKRRKNTGRQGECRTCKKFYNNRKNRTRLIEQHREAAQKRRLYVDLAGDEPLDVDTIRSKFNHACFKCGTDVSGGMTVDFELDHTLPMKYLWPYTTSTATLLCRKHNGEKAEKWPSEFYKKSELKKLSVLTGLPYDLLSGPPCYNPEALLLLQNRDTVIGLLEKFAPYREEILKLRNRILDDTGIDMLTAVEDLATPLRNEAESYRL